MPRGRVNTELMVYGIRYGHNNEKRIIVAAYYKAHALKAFRAAGFRMSDYEFLNFGGRTTNPYELEIARAKPGVVFETFDLNGPPEKRHYKEVK